MRIIVRSMAKRRMVMYMEERIKRMIDCDLQELGMSESDFLQRAAERYYPEIRRLARALNERRGQTTRT